jgi:sugar lactone lactonase YvrE
MRRATGSKCLLILIGIGLLSATRAGAVDGNSIIDTLAGGGNGDGFPAAVASVDPDTVSVGPDGSIYVAESSQHRIRRINPQSGFIETFAGIGSDGFAGDNGPAHLARLSYPTSAAADQFGNVYICDQSNHRIRRVSSNGIITTVAGTGVGGYNGENLPALTAKLYYPRSISIDSAGNVLIAEPYNQRIRYLNVANGTISTVAGSGQGGYAGDGGPANAATAKLQLPSGVAALPGGGFLIADTASHHVRKVDSAGIIHTVAGVNPTASGYNGDNIAATSAKLSNPMSVAARSDGSILIVDQGNQRLRLVSPNGTITTIAGTGTLGYNGDGIAGTQAQLNRPSGVAVTAQGDCLIADLDNLRVRGLDNCAGNGAISTMAGIPTTFTGDGWPALVAQLTGPSDTLKDAFGNTYIVDSPSNRIRRIRADGIIETYAGTGQAGSAGDGGPASAAQLKQPYRVALDLQGNLLVLDTGNRRLRRINTATGVIVNVAGTGDTSNTGDGGPALNASFIYPLGLAVDTLGRIYIADASARRVRRIELNGQINTIAGTGVATGTIDGPGGNPADNLGDEGPALNATFISPSDVEVDAVGNVYVTDMSANYLRRIDPTGIIHAVAGTGTGTGRVDGPGGDPSDDLGDGGPATRASLYTPVGIDIALNGDLLVADQANRRIRMIRNGVISTIAGDGVVTWNVDGEGGNASDDLGDGGPASRSTFISLSSVYADGLGNVLVTDSQSERVRVLLGSGAPPPTPTNPPAATGTPTFTSIPPTSTPQPTATRTATKTNTAGTTTVSVSGHVKYYANANVDVPTVDIALTGPQSQTARTNNAGDYTSPIMPGGTWYVSPAKSGGFGNAVSSLDAARVLQVIAGLSSFTPLQRLACDVTGDGSLSALDATRILQFSAGVIDRLPVAQTCGSDWIFNPISSQGTVVPPDVGGGACQTGSIVLNQQSGQAANQDFQAVLFGDCTGNWTSGAALRQMAHSANAVHAGALRHASGNRWRLPIYVQGTTSFQALDVSVAYDAHALQLATVHPTGAAAGALLGVSNERSGVVAVSLASGMPIHGGGVVLMVEFTGSGANPSSVQLTGAEIDEQPARVVASGAH